MGDRATLLALADRVEAAIMPLPDRTLSRAIARAVGWGYQAPSEARRKGPAWFHPDDCRDGKPVLCGLHGTDVWREPLDYVGSLDAVLTLVDPDAFWRVGHDGDGPDPALFKAIASVSKEGEIAITFRTATAVTAPLALCAAALRARAEAAHD